MYIFFVLQAISTMFFPGIFYLNMVFDSVQELVHLRFMILKHWMKFNEANAFLHITKLIHLFGLELRNGYERPNLVRGTETCAFLNFMRKFV